MTQLDKINNLMVLSRTSLLWARIKQANGSDVMPYVQEAKRTALMAKELLEEYKNDTTRTYTQCQDMIDFEEFIKCN